MNKSSARFSRIADEQEGPMSHRERNKVRTLMPAPSRSIFNFGKKKKLDGIGDVKLLSAPKNLWSEEGLDKMYAEEYL